MCEMEALSFENFMQKIAAVCKERDELRKENARLREALQNVYYGTLYPPAWARIMKEEEKR